jgi:Uma2 family endonuclease
MTAEAYRKLPETNQPMELIDGEVVMSPAPKDSHQKVVTNTLVSLSRLIPDGELRVAPSDVYFDDENVLQPDVLWVSESNENCRLLDDYWHGPPDLVVEILSPGTALRDRQVKFEIYQKHGVREYWVGDLYQQTMEVWQLEEGRFQRLGVFGKEDAFRSAVLGDVNVELAEIFT